MSEVELRSGSQCHNVQIPVLKTKNKKLSLKQKIKTQLSSFSDVTEYEHPAHLFLSPLNILQDVRY